MKRYFIVFTVCMALMLVGLCVMLKFVCLGNCGANSRRECTYRYNMPQNGRKHAYF